MSRLSIDESADANGGSSGSGGESEQGGRANTGGKDSSGGSADHAGTATSMGGEPPGTAGTSAVGGSTGGTSPTGDAGAENGGAGGAEGTAGTAGAGGTNGGTGGTSGGAGGKGGAGGTPGTAGSAGTSGTAGAGGTGVPPATCTDPVACIDEVANVNSDFGNPGWKSSWWVMGCGQKSAHDCISNGVSCNATDGAGPEDQGARTTEKWLLGGEKGQHYKVTFTFNGVVGGKIYTGGMRDAGALPANPYTNTPLDLFYRDGSSLVSNYDVWKLTVFDDAMQPVRHYYMNAGVEANPGTWENHVTFLASYTKSIVVIGQGKIEHLIQDRNCHAIDNCGPDAVVGDVCPAPRKLPGADANLLLPSKYKDPTDGIVKSTLLLESAYPSATLAQPWHAQAAHLTITAITKTSDPVTKDY